MKKYIFTVLAILTSGAVYALPVGNPSETSLLSNGFIWDGYCDDYCDSCFSWCDALSLRIGFYGDYAFNKKIIEYDHFEIYTNATYLALNLCNRIDVFSTLGASSIYAETRATAGERFEIQAKTDFSWSIGARGTIWECGCTAIGAEAQYFYTKPDTARITFETNASSYDNFHIKYNEWQIGLGISHRIYNLVPYTAVKWSRSKIDNDDDWHLLTGGGGTASLDSGLKSKSHWGYAVGVTLIGCDTASLTVEGRFGNEKAVYLNGQIRL
jgi:major outer membrane protein